MGNDRTYDVNNLPDDAEIYTGQQKEFAPIDSGEIYQVLVEKIELKDNMFYKPEEEDPAKRGQKYTLSIQLMILNEGEFQGRKLWDNASLALKPTTKQGKPTKLFKIVTKAMKTEFDWDMCAAFATDIKTLYKNLQENVVGEQVRVSIESITHPETHKVRTKVVSYNEIKAELPIPEKKEEAPSKSKVSDVETEEDITA